VSHPATFGGAWPAITLRHAASSVAPGLRARALPASLPGLVLATQASTNATGRLTHG
jgi:hypothetical protein